MRKRALASILGGLSLAVGCSTTHTVPLQTSDVSPASDGQVKVKPQGPNTALTVDVKHLAPPDRIAPDAVTYVVWIRPLNARSQPQNVGSLTLDKNREGKLQTMTPYRTFELFVTAESSSVADTPSGDRLLYTQVVERGS
jgi:hypothetical protein